MMNTAPIIWIQKRDLRVQHLYHMMTLMRTSLCPMKANRRTTRLKAHIQNEKQAQQLIVTTISHTLIVVNRLVDGGGGGDDDGAWAGTGPGSGIAGTIDVLVRGVVVGFMWPLGSGAWLMREEGMSSGRSRFMVGVGVLFSVLIGVIRAISGER